MNIVIWLLAGGVVGWTACLVLKANMARTMFASIAIGTVGAFLGGVLLAPLVGNGPANPNDFNPFALFVALASAIACLIIGNMIYRRYGF